MKIAQIVGGVLARFPDILRAMAMPLLLVMALDTAIYYSVGPAYLTYGREAAILFEDGPANLYMIQMLIGFWVGVMVPVRWHRFVIVGDTTFRWWTFPMGAREWSYFGWLVLQALIIAGILIVPGVLLMMAMLSPTMLASGQIAMAPGAQIWLMAMWVCVWSLWLGAFGLVLPAAALEQRIGGLGGSVQAARPYFWRFTGRILILSVIGFGALLLFLQVGQLFAAWYGARLLSVLVMSATGVIGPALAMVLSTTALSFNYGDAFGWPAQQAGHAPPPRDVLPPPE